MKSIVLNLWAWIIAHPAETMGGLYLALNALNALIPVEARKTSRLAAVLDRLCVLTQRGAVGATSWPVVGRSIAKEIVAPERETQAPPPPRESEPAMPDASIYVYRDNSAQCWVATPRNGHAMSPSARGATPEEAKTKLREMIAARAEELRQHPERAYASERRESEPGYAESRVLAVIAALSLVALAALAGCPMPAPDGCSPGARRCHEDTPQVCSPGQRWTPADVTCSTVNASCVVRDGVPACLRGEQ